MSSVSEKEQVSPPHKRAKEDADEKKKTPHDIFFQNLRAVSNQNNGIAYTVIRGIKDNTNDDEEDGWDDEEEEEEEVGTSKFTTEQMQHVRVIVMTQDRADALEEMEKLILGDQYGHSITMFSTSYSYHVFDSWQDLKQMLARKSWPDKFNLLFGFTNTIRDYDVWMMDHEIGCGIEIFLADLAKRWKTMLKKSNEELGIDAEFTRPGIVCFLEEFKSAVEGIDTYDEPAIKFNFQ